jgi:hypothetical protein
MASYQDKHEIEENRPILRYPPDDWGHREVYQGVHRAIKALPNFFESELFITGVLVTDEHHLIALANILEKTP